MIFKTLILLVFFVSFNAHSQVKVIASTTDIAWSVKQIGGERVQVESLLTGRENPHYSEVVPSFVLKVANADIVCSIGLELEIGWLPKVLSRSGNANVQSGGKGHCVLGEKVAPLEKPKGAVDRSMGDVHASGNPHFWLSPKVFAKSSEAILESLIRVDPEGENLYKKNYEDLKVKLNRLSLEIQQKLHSVSMRKIKFMEYHKEFSYFFNEFGITVNHTLEKIPGMPPSSGRIAQMAALAKDKKIKGLIATEYQSKSIIQKFQELSGVKAIVVSSSIHKRGTISDYPSLMKTLADSLASYEKP